MPTARPNHLDWPDCRNVRELGGIPASDGRRIRSGALIRADSLAGLTEAGVSAVRTAGVSRIVDVRTAAECERTPTRFAGDPLWRNVPVEDVSVPGGLPGTTIVSTYARMLDDGPHLFAAAIRTIATAPAGAVVVHCHGGKDRTGLAVALSLALAGVPDDEIVADYALTRERLAGLLAELLAAESDPGRRARIEEFADTRPEAMTATLDHLRTTYDGPEGYLRHGGLTGGEAAALRDRLAEPHP